MSDKDYILISISASALILSLTSLIITLVQKTRETRRTIKKNLSDTLEAISKINIETAKLRSSKDLDPASEAIVLLRRSYNTQRRTLIAHADFLVNNYDGLVTDIDCNVLAGAHATIGDIDRAEHYWRKTLEKTKSDPLRVMNLRGFAAFWYGVGENETGREYFNSSLAIALPENDHNKAIRIDTYLMFYDLESDHGAADLRSQCLQMAMDILATVKNGQRKAELQKDISKRLKKTGAL